ncbi:flagellar export chaperone FliS [Desulfovibrio oxyclinae]|jgi:flagellar protein FliS|uniref:flagellar export chaperone FliS n=1 Tax=Desulfovibrio oxyclinae TaxID=63560 RepID=UPI0003780946|nr:flagellar export chaperone FliS [Desulfovibrio oxyclinae]
MANPAKAYLAVQVETTSQGQLLLMLYEACIKFLRQAKVEIEKKDYAKKGILISRALAIIHELTESLNKEKGGEISKNLAGIYMFCTNELTQANIKLDVEKIENVIKMMDSIRSAYEQIIPEAQKKNGAAGTQPAAPAAPQAVPRPEAQKPAEQQAAQQEQKPAQEQKPTPSTPPNGYPGTMRPGQPGGPQLRPVSPKPQVNAAKSRANNAYSNANR